MKHSEVVKLRNSSRYRKLRTKFFADHPLCQNCLKNGFHVAGEELDHIIPVHIAPERFWDIDNLQMLCKDCHFKKSKNEMNEKYKKSKDATWNDMHDSILTAISDVNNSHDK